MHYIAFTLPTFTFARALFTSTLISHHICKWYTLDSLHALDTNTFAYIRIHSHINSYIHLYKHTWRRILLHSSTLGYITLHHITLHVTLQTSKHTYRYNCMRTHTTMHHTCIHTMHCTVLHCITLYLAFHCSYFRCSTYKYKHALIANVHTYMRMYKHTWIHINILYIIHTLQTDLNIYLHQCVHAHILKSVI